MSHPAPSKRTHVRRLPDRARYDFDTLAAVIDSAPICTIAFNWEGSVHALPTAHWREGEHLYIHGARASRMLRALAAGECCVTLSHVDGLVYARSAFHHSMNYRSAVIYGRFAELEEAAKEASLRAFIEHLSPGRWDQLRPINAKELYATTLLRLPLHEAVVKMRSGGPKDDDEDMAWPVWAGVVPLRLAAGEAQTAPDSVVGEIPAKLGGALLAHPPQR
ncbi:pyridoxamine 5'-phosphate oxidase family protein [Pseudothauera nasutitermitis]|uniref:Pyridoxamine 5'-phosphate oxidase family protein n=1 Tax=Pseudothauera nasutitermitis TaxID=2565930 RepID=A0A4S4ASX0_9RHOO|nr:pyridoxamine 5'-phosphate oxidase family protein [Pseudothauera nasutitermitis]THF62954.1 pyridoxamine 5'-phosphate oxidase family protein [Pseudothauera nasutitermitis]